MAQQKVQQKVRENSLETPDADASNKPSNKPRKQQSRYIPVNTKREIFQRDRVCQFKDPLTGDVCASRYQLEIDHIRMVCHGGSNKIDNLRLICRKHNFFLATQKLGSSWMAQFSKPPMSKQRDTTTL